MAEYNIQDISISKLEFDKKNPRLVEFDYQGKVTEEKLVETLCRIMEVEEIILSLHHSGYFGQRGWSYRVVLRVGARSPGILLEGSCGQ